MPNLPENNNITREKAVNLILTSIAMEELGLSHILNAEGEKLQYMLGTSKDGMSLDEPPTVKDILEVNKSVHQTLNNAARLQMMLGTKMESAMSTSTSQGPPGPPGPPGPTGSPGLVGVILASYNSLEDLIADHKTGNQGDAYLVAGDLYVWDTNTKEWRNVGTLAGPAGPKGSTGPVGVILGSYGSLEELKEARKTGNQGDAYLVNGDLYVWNVSTQEWEWVGNLQGPAGPMGPRGLDGPEGQQGPQGEQGIQGEAGIVGTIRGSYETETALRADHPEGGEPGDFYYINPDLWVWDEINDDWINVGQIAGPQGIQGVQGERGEAGPPGATGPVGTILGSFNTIDELEIAHPTGNQGESYLVGGDLYVWNVVTESWERVGTLIGPTGPEGPSGATGPTGPAGAPVEAYNFNLSASGSYGEATVGNVIFRLAYVSNTSISLYIRPASSQVLIDFARSSFFNLGGINYVETQYHDHYTLSTSIGVDTSIFSQSNEQQKSWLRQQNPDGTWSLCEYSIFASRNAARVTLWINWIYKDLEILW